MVVYRIGMNVVACTLAIMSAAAGMPASLGAQRMDGRASTLSSTSSLARRADTLSFPRPGDVVRVKIWREPDMSGDFTVDANGRATLPRIGAIQVTNMAPDSLQRLMVAEYARYLKNPSIEVLVMRRVRVVGAVRTPGLYTADQTMRVRDVLAMAGGANDDGRKDVVRLDRDGRSMSINLAGSPDANDTPLRSGDQLYVPQRSWIARNTPLVASIVSVGGGLLIALSTR